MSEFCRSPMGSCYSALSTKAVRVCAAIRPGIAATRFANTRAPTATRITDKTGTVGSGTALILRANTVHN